MTFAVVEFPDEKSVAVVPTSWLTTPEGQACRWPPTGLDAADKMVRASVPPKDTWLIYNSRVLIITGIVICQ